MKTKFTNSQLRKLCTGKPTLTVGYHPSHRCKDVYLITPTGGPVAFYGHNPAELKSRLEWHKEAMGEWLADPLKRRMLENEVSEGLCDTREEAIQLASPYINTRFIENGKLHFVSRQGHGGGLTISEL